MYTPPANVISVIIDPTGTPVTLKARLIHLTKVIGSRPSEFIVLLLDKRPKDVALTDYQGKAAVIKVDAVTKLTGNVMRVEKQFSQQNVILTIQDYRWKINRTYVGASFLDTLDGNGVASAFNGLPYYGADVIFNLNGRPNKSKTALDFVPPGYENNVTNADYWTYGQALEYLWSNFVSDVAMPTISGANPSAWTIGGMNKKMDEWNAFGVPVAEAIQQLVNRTRCQWYLDASNVAKFFAITTPVATFALDIPDPDAPTNPTSHTPIEFNVEHSVDDSVGQLDIIGGKQIREVMFKSVYTGSVYDDTLTLVSTDFVYSPWFGIDMAGGWTTNAEVGILPAAFLPWQNFSVERYIHIYTASYPFSSIPHEYKKRWNLKPGIFEAHKIGKNITAVDQPYKMLPQILLGRDKNGNYINPDEPSAIEGVSPMELVRTQYPDEATLDLDRGYLLTRGLDAWLTNPRSLMQPPYFGASFPRKLTVAVECAYRAYVSAIATVTGQPSPIRRAVIRNELVHKTREATEVIMPVLITFAYDGGYAVSEGVPVPTGATRNYLLTSNVLTTGPVDPNSLTITLPEGIVVDGMAALNEVKSVVSDYVGLPNVSGNLALPTWMDLELGSRLTGATEQYDTTDLEIVTAISFSDENNQQLEAMFTNRLGNDVFNLAQAFVDQRGYRRVP